MSWRPILEEGPLADGAKRAVIDLAGQLTSAAASPSVASGSAAKALWYGFLARATGDESHGEIASGFLDAAFDGVGKYEMRPGLYAGFAGVAWTSEILDQLFPDPAGSDDVNEEIDPALLDHLAPSPWRGDYDLIGGLVGVGVYALERVGRPTGRALLERVVEQLAASALRDGDGARWRTANELLPPHQRGQFPDGYVNLGLAHGVAGVIAFLAGAARAGVARARPLLDEAVRWLLARRHPERGFGYVDGDGAVARSAWCYGDCGVGAVLQLAGRAASEAAWERAGVETALVASRRSAVEERVEDAMICHGAAGLAHLYNRMWQRSGDGALREVALRWFERTLRREEGWRRFDSIAREYRDDEGLLEGRAGIGLVLLAATTSVEPTWDRLLQLSLPGGL